MCTQEATGISVTGIPFYSLKQKSMETSSGIEFRNAAAHRRAGSTAELL